jgi:hypothetical protein
MDYKTFFAVASGCLMPHIRIWEQVSKGCKKLPFEGFKGIKNTAFAQFSTALKES